MAKYRSKSIVALSLAAALAWTASAALLPQRAAAAATTAEVTTVASSVLSPQAQEYADYLQEKYGIAVAASWTREQYADALNAIVSPGAEKSIVLTGNTSEPLTAIEAVSLALKAADLEELAYTYSASKAKGSLAWVKLGDAYRTSDIIQATELRKVVDEALKQNLVTGYNLKDSRYDANFLDSLSVVYGHSDFKHALQLVGLLRSERIKAKVQFEPKTSAFIYLKEWGEPGQSDLYEVVQIENGNYIEYAKEYDLAFEFDSAYDKERFDRIILSYAKKDEDDQPGLIYGSWWQPLYYSLTELGGYKEISNNKISAGKYYAQSFSLKDQSATVAEGFKKLDPSASVVSYDFWVDGPFYNYLQGESK